MLEQVTPDDDMIGDGKCFYRFMALQANNDESEGVTMAIFRPTTSDVGIAMWQCYQQGRAREDVAAMMLC